MRYKIFNNITFLLIVMSLVNLNSKAHTIPGNHQLCLKALDYDGCIRFNQKTITTSNSVTARTRKYGSLKIYMNTFQSRGDTHIAKAFNKTNQQIYIAINCKAKKINTTGLKNIWKGWLPPSKKFEFSLINDVCD